MTFHTAAMAETRLASIEEVIEWADQTQKRLVRVPVDGVLEQGGRFVDDAYFGDGDTLLHFNRAALAAVCRKLGVKQALLEELQTPELATTVLNDLLAQRSNRDELKDAEFVLDETVGTVIGLVSKTYVTYSNAQFVRDITKRLGSLGEEQGFSFQEAYGVNTALTLRFVASHEHGTIESFGGRGVDKSRIGLEFANSMVGDSAVRLNYFLFRLVCSNGMMVPAATSINRIFHSGDPITFGKRLDRSFAEVLRSLHVLQELLLSLGSTAFNPEALAREPAVSKQIFEIIPGSKSELCEKTSVFLRYPSDASPSDREKIRREHDTQLIASIPGHFGREDSRKIFDTPFRKDATLFDFLNVFTEYAKGQSPSRRLGMEERAGGMAKYLAANAKKL